MNNKLQFYGNVMREVINYFFKIYFVIKLKVIILMPVGIGVYYISSIFGGFTKYTQLTVLDNIKEMFLIVFIGMLGLVYLKIIKTLLSYWRWFWILTALQSLFSVCVVFLAYNSLGIRLFGVYLILILVLYYTSCFYIMRLFLKSPNNSVLN